MDALMDIVIGDFGRPGTLRYLEAFSARERELIASSLPDGDEFLDEHRRVQLTVLCQLRIVKRTIFDAYEREGRAIDREMMVGTSFGTPVAEIVPTLAEVLRRQVGLAAGQGVRAIRVVIPCNTLGVIAAELRGELGGEAASRGVALRVEPMQPLVGADLRDRGIGSVLVLGTPGSVAAYRRMLAEIRPVISVLDNPAELTDAYERCINDAIRGERPRPAAFSLVRAHAERQLATGGEVLEACTDVSLGIGSDALQIYANRLAYDAYSDVDKSRFREGG
jgi:hypothetical protein